VARLLLDADWVKLNTDEMRLLAPAAGNAEAFIAEHRLHGLILTHGADGAEIVTPDGGTVRIRPDKGSSVVDTVGAGDAFASVMLLGLLRNWPIQLTAGRAQDFACRMVGQRGATVSDPHFYQDVMCDWQIDGRQEFADV
jgi:fructokinase